MRSMRRISTAAVVAAAGVAAPVLAADVEVIFSKKTGHPTAALAGARDAGGNPVAAEWKALEDLVVAPDGSRWLIKARNTLGSDLETGVVSGTGDSGAILTITDNGTPYVVQEGQPAPFGAAASWFDFVSSGFARFDGTNKLVLGMRARTAPTGSTNAPDGMRVIKIDGNAATLAFKQSQLYTNLVDIVTNPSGDETVGNSPNAFHLLNDGRVGAHDNSIINISSTRRPALTYALDKFKQVVIDSVTAYGGSGTVVISAIDSNSFQTTPDGQHYWFTGKHTSTLAAGPEIFVYDGAVVLERDQVIPGSTVVVGDIFQVFMNHSGRYIARGRDNSGTTAAAPDWVVVDGALVAKTGDPITPGSTELWGDTILAVTMNNAGDTIVIGNTNADEASNNVIVLNGTTVVAREGDPIDLDGNGQFDDDAFIGRGVNTNAAFGVNVNNGSVNWWLDNNLTLWGILMLRDGNGVDINNVPAFGTPQAFVRIPLATGTTCYANCDESTNTPFLNVLDFNCFLNKFNAADPTANCDGSTNDPMLNVLDFNCFLNAFNAGCTAP